MTLDEQIRSALRIAKHIAETGGDGLEERQVDEIKALIANQVREARIEMYNLYGEPRCSQLHHPKKDQHPFLEDCPVVNRIKELGE